MKKIILASILAIFIFYLVCASPEINFTSPTPDNNLRISNDSLELNVTINEQNLSSLVYNWNNTNYTFLNSSLVLMMNFDNLSALGENSTFIKDLSEYENNGIAIKTIPTTNGKYGGAYTFNGTGSGDLINITNNNGLNLSSNAITVSAWVKFNGDLNTGHYNPIIGKASNNAWTDGWGLFQADNKMYFYVNHYSTYGAYKPFTDTSSWHYIVGRYDGTTVSVFVDGVNGTNKALNADILNAGNIQIGKIGHSDGSWNGTIDEIRVWNRSLTNDEIYLQYRSNLRKFNTTGWNLYINQSNNLTSGLGRGNYTYQIFAINSTGGTSQTEKRNLIIQSDVIPPLINFTSPTPENGTTTLSTTIIINVSIIENNLAKIFYNWNSTNYTFLNNSLVLKMNLNNLSSLSENSSLVADIAQFSNNGTVTGANWTSSGKYGGAYQFFGFNSGNVIDAGNPDSIKINGNSITVSAWIKFNGDSNPSHFPPIIGKSSGSAWNNGWGLYANQNKMYFYVNDYSTYNAEINFTDTSAWHFVVGRYNGTAVSVFVDGIKGTDKSLSATISDAGTLQIGRIGNSDSSWNGTIDEISLWNKALTNEEIYLQYKTSLSKISSTDWNLYVNQSKNLTSELSIGNYTYQIFVEDLMENSNQTEQRNIQIVDVIYPKFSDIVDDNATLIGSGTANFNATILNTSGEVWLEINSANYTATNISSNTYKVSITLSAGIYNYTWKALGDGPNHNLNQSETKYYTIKESPATQSSPTATDSGGGSFSFEQNTEQNNIEMKMFILPNKTIIESGIESNETGITEIELTAKELINGNLKISGHSDYGDCNIKNREDYLLYKTLVINSTFNIARLDKSRIRINIPKTWFSENNISYIKTIKCSQQYEELQTEYINETKESKVYDIISQSLNNFVIIGISEKATEETAVSEVKKEEKQSNYFLIIIIILLIIIIGLLIYKYHKEH